MLGIGLGVLMFTLDVSIVNIALPTLVEQLNTSFAMVQWVVLSYLLVITVLVLGAARLGDMLGKQRLYLWGLILFTLSSLLCGLAPDINWLIGFRALQGFGAVFIAALGAAIITEVFPASERGRALGIIGGIVSLGIALGPSVGGLLIGLGGWRIIFLVNFPLGIFASFIVLRFVTADPARESQGRFDWAGAVIFALVLSCFSLGMTAGQRQGFNSPVALALLGIAAVGLILFLSLEVRLKQPMLDLRLFRDLQLSLSLLIAMLVFIVVAGSIFIMPFFLELVKDYPTQQVGLLLAVSPVVGGLVAPASGALSDRFGTRLITLIGLGFLMLGCWVISTFDAQLTLWGFVLGYAPFGLGLGMFQSPNNSAIMGSVPPERLGIASGLLALSRTLGQTTGVPLMASIFAVLAGTRRVETASATALTQGLQGTFRISALLILAAALVGGCVWWLEQRQPGIDRP